MLTLGKDLLKKLRNTTIDGEAAHCVYSPPYRPLFTYEEILTKNPKFAAVNILLYLKDGEWYFPLMLRTENEHDRHSGQISFPGGKREESDINFAETAKRETAEEIGIDASFIKIIRALSPIYIPPSNFYVHPYVSFTKKNPTFLLEENEVMELIEFPVSSLLNLPDQPKMKILPSTKGHEVPVIDFDGYIIWGATAMILSEFSNLLKNV